MSLEGLLIKNDVIEINKGSDKEFELHFFTEEGKNFDLTNYTIFEVCIKAKAVTGGYLRITEVANANASVVAKKTPNELGQLVVTLKAADVAELDEREAQEIFAKIEKTSGERQTFTYKDALNVYPNPCN